MKKTITLLTILLTTSIYAQFGFGVKGGFTLAYQEVGANGYALGDNKYTFNIGVFAEYKPSKFAFNSEIFYSDLGSKTNQNQLDLSTIVIAISPKYYVTEKLSFLAGGYYGFILDSKMKHEEIDLNSFENYDAGIKFGISYNITDNIFVDAQYFYGLVKIYESPEFPFPNQPFDPIFMVDNSIKNRFLNIGVGYKF